MKQVEDACFLVKGRKHLSKRVKRREKAEALENAEGKAESLRDRREKGEEVCLSDLKLRLLGNTPYQIRFANLSSS